MSGKYKVCILIDGTDNIHKIELDNNNDVMLYDEEFAVHMKILMTQIYYHSIQLDNNFIEEYLTEGNYRKLIKISRQEFLNYMEASI